jgi:HEPN domain-containing protein
MDIDKQILYWTNGAKEDFAAAQSLLEKGHLRHCLFMAHLALEKILKAHVVSQTKNIPPKIHNLVRLSQIANLKLPPEQEEFLREFGLYQLEGRYPDTEQITFETDFTKREMLKAGEMLIWLSNL